MIYKIFELNGIRIMISECDDHEKEHLANLKQAFESVCNQNDWKAPIDCWIERDQFGIVKEAIEYYTATEATLIELEYFTGRNVQDKPMIRVVADGYRYGPAGP